MMVAYLPADDPEIAIGISIEYGGYGARAGDLVVDIANAYFAMKDGTLEKQAEEEAAQSQADQQAADTQQSTGTANGTQTTTGTANAAGTAGTSGTAQPTQTEPAAQPATAETELPAAEPDTEDNPDAIAPETVPQETG